MTVQEEFIAKIAPIIVSFCKSRGYKVASPIIAQAVIESRYGESVLAKKYFNYFGMKCGAGWSGRSVNLSTKEEYKKGTLTNITANFRVYDSMEEGVKGYFDFISAKRYSNLKTASTPQEYLTMIKADGYATSSTYVQTNMKAVTTYNLTKYDEMILGDSEKRGKDIRKVSAVNLNARLSPMGAKLFLLSAGDEVNVVQEKDGWCKIEAYVSSSYLVK